jgi:membrane-associated protease RseP (regulator of RpoE activity)
MTSQLSRLGLIFTVAFSIFITGCATPPRSVATPSGRPEAVMAKAPLKEVQSVLTNVAMNAGFSTKSVTDFTAVYEKPSDNVAATMLFGSRYDSTPVWRMSFNFAPIGEDLRVVGMMQIVTNPGSAFERVNDMSRNTVDAVNLQSHLDALKEHYALVASVATRGKVGVGFSNEGKVTVLVKGGPAELAGLLVGDQVISIDGAPYGDSRSASTRVTGDPGTKVSLRISRGGSLKDVEIVRGQP